MSRPLTAWSLVASCGLAACAPPPDPRPTNADLSAAVEVALALDPTTSALDLRAIPDAGVIRVAGFTETMAQQDHALRVAAAVPGVVEALDNMTLLASARARIVSDVGAALAAQPDLAGIHFLVTVDDGVVSLSSENTNPEQRRIALETVQAVEDVTAVEDRMR